MKGFLRLGSCLKFQGLPANSQRWQQSFCPITVRSMARSVDSSARDTAYLFALFLHS
jgi:hypothetical protein